MILFYLEHGYARLGETFVILQKAPPVPDPWAQSFGTSVKIGNVFRPLDSLLTSQIRGHLL